MPLEDSIQNEAELLRIKTEKNAEDLEREFGKLLKEISVDSTADILTNEDKFSLIIRKTKNLITFAGNKFIYYLKTSNNNKLNYITIDDYSQDAKMMLWNIIEANPDKPLTEILKIFKTALWRITICYFRKSRLKKNLGVTLIPSSVLDGDTISDADSFDNMVYRNTKKSTEGLNSVDRDEMKRQFSEFLKNSSELEDANIFEIIAYPKPEFLDHCHAACNSKKKKHKDVISQSNIASYLKVSINHVHNRVKRLAAAFSEFKEQKFDR